MTNTSGEWRSPRGRESITSLEASLTLLSDHMEAPDVLRIAGCDAPTKSAPTKSASAEVLVEENQRSELERLDREMKEWREGRAAEIEK